MIVPDPGIIQVWHGKPYIRLQKMSVQLQTDVISISQRFFPCWVKVFVDETDDTTELKCHSHI